MVARVYFVKYFKHYLLGLKFILRTDHESLVWLHKFWELLTIDRGLLCYRWMEKDCETLKVCVPRILCDSVMWYLHDAKTAGHMGIRRTISKLMNSQYYWPQ